VLIHGLWVTPRSWEKWVERYEGRGYRVLTPAYPGFEVEVEALNEDPFPIETVTIPAVVEHLEGIVGELDSAPIIMGHSAEGFFTQALLDHGYGAAGVAIDSAPAEGVRVTPVSQIRSLFPILKNPANRHRAVGFTPEQFHYAFANNLSREKSDKVYQRYHIRHPAASSGPGRWPTSRQVTKMFMSASGTKTGTVAVYSGRRRQPHASSGQPIQRQALPHQIGH
jgi:pimeloyl-ACP methyl ester carboxylesterase